MVRVINIGNTSISLDFVTIAPKTSHIWADSEISFSLRRKIWRLRGMGLIQIEEYSDPIIEEVIEEQPQEIKEEIIQEVEEVKKEIKPKKKNTRKKSQKKEE